MAFKDKLKSIRLSKKVLKPMLQKDLAKLSGIQVSVISHFESGKRKPSIKNLLKLADALECSIDDLLKNDE